MVKFPKQLVLASASPRRKELLEALKLDFIVHPSKFTEKSSHTTPHELALHNAIGKAQEVASHYKNALIIGVDTIVSFQGHQIGKPKARAQPERAASEESSFAGSERSELIKEDAKRILRLLSNTTHEVISAICVIDTDNFKNITATETTLVTLDRLEEAEIEAYVQSGEGNDKAGGFAIQGRGALFVKKIDGDYFNVVGLPIFRLKKLLREFGIKSLI